jgi:hypothetical protein
MSCTKKKNRGKKFRGLGSIQLRLAQFWKNKTRIAKKEKVKKDLCGRSRAARTGLGAGLLRHHKIFFFAFVQLSHKWQK